MSLYRFLASARELKDYATNENNTQIKIAAFDNLKEASQFTDKKNCATLEWTCNDQNIDLLISYIKEHLKTCPRIELWRVGRGDKSTAIIEKCSKNILSKEKIKELWGKDGLCQSACLVVYNS